MFPQCIVKEIENGSMEDRIGMAEHHLKTLYDCLKKETFEHNHTRTKLQYFQAQSMEKERYACYEYNNAQELRSVVYDLRTKVQDAEMARMKAEQQRDEIQVSFQ
jgi:hypothetical protein